MKYEVLYNFISPITGALITPMKYTILGDERGYGYPSPILEYLKNNTLLLKKQLDDQIYLSYGAIEIGNRYGVKKEVKLAEAVFPNPVSGITGDFRIPNPTFDYLSPFDWVMSGPFLPQIYATKYDALGNPVGTDVSSSLAMTQVRAAQIMKRFDNANFIVGSSTVEFVWENPKMYLIPEALKQLYGLGTTYTFTKAQSLGALETGLLKNTVNNGTGTLSKAIPGTDYVELTNIPVGPIIVYNQDKFISPTEFSIRKNKPNEFGDPVGNTINVLTGIASSFAKLAITGITAGSLIKISNNFSELIPAVKGTDYVAPDDIKLNHLIKIIKLLVGVKDTVDFLSITTEQASNLNKIVKTIGGVKDTVDMIDVTVSDASKLTNAVKSVVGVAETVEIAETAAKAADVFVNKAALLDIEAQIAALAGVATVNALFSIFSTIGIVAGGYHYGQYIRGQSLNVSNTWNASDLNDECSNATGTLRPLSITPYKYENRGHGTLWFDSNGRTNDGQGNNRSEAGVRLFSWDSSLTDTFDSDLSPLHIGLFGYRKYLTQPDEYKGFIFKTEFDTDKQSSVPGVINNPNYRFPIKFGLYDVHKKVSSLSQDRYGWDSKDTIFEYDYNSFNFSKPVHTKKLVATDNLTIPSKLSSEIPIDSATGSIFYCSDL